ncbi:MAG: hypothetical protein HYR73_09180 [Candidatus Eisenbacteria bacterium]|nr:hypothetical protein [Candidatus Eisenbacteria bacterium]
MISRFRWVSIAALALLTAASACLAAEPAAGKTAGDPGASPANDATSATGQAPAAPNAPERRGDHPGYGGISGQFGLGRIGGYQDYSQWAQLRMSFSANWRYTFSDSWRGQVSPGFVWAGYAKTSNPAPFVDLNHPTDPYKDDWLTLVVPISTQMQWVRRGRTFTWHVGAGPGLYRVWVENHRKVVKDPRTYIHHRGLYWGGTAEIGAEHFFKGLASTSIEMTLDMHYVNAKRDDQFPSGYNSALRGAGLRVGATYYFNLHHAPENKSAPLPGTTKH